MDKILEALGKLIPEEQLKEVSTAIEAILHETKKEMDAEYDAKLAEGYKAATEEVETLRAEMQEGYKQAYAVVQELWGRVKTAKEEGEKQKLAGFEEAYQLLKAEKEKAAAQEIEIYEEYDKKLQDMKAYIVDKVNEFLQFKGQEIYEQAKRDILTDPRMAEHKVALDKIVEVAAAYLNTENLGLATSSRIDALQKENAEYQKQLRIMEARSIRQDQENKKLHEDVQKAAQLISESSRVLTEQKKVVTKSEQNVRAAKSQKVSGRGQAAVGDNVVIAEQTQTGEYDELMVLSGLSEAK